jgi:CBS-domain-containing membrane protein
MIQAKDIMSEDLVVVYDDMRVSQVAHLLLRQRVSGFPVLSREKKILGIVTMTDLFRVIHETSVDSTDHAPKAKIAELKEIPVSLIMSRNIVTITPQTTLAEIVRFVAERGMHSFPVMENGQMVGIVGRHDILNAVFAYD